MKAIQVQREGSDIKLALGEIEKPAPREGEVLIKVAAAGVNHADLIQARGGYPPPPGAPDTLGLEVSGVIADVGTNVSEWNVGDRVCALLGGGGYAEYVAVSQLCVLPVPKDVSLVDAAALPEVHFTVWTNLMDAARLKAGESVLIHGGSSGIGTAAIQLCAARGHKVFATAGSKEKCAACEKLGSARAINYRSQDFVAAVKDATGGAGVDVILDMVGGSYVQRNIAACAQWGRIVNIAYQDGVKVAVDFTPVLTKKLTLAATTLRGRCPEQKRLIRNALAEIVWPLLETGRIRPVIDRRFGFAEANAAHAAMGKGGHIGKILLVL